MHVVPLNASIKKSTLFTCRPTLQRRKKHCLRARRVAQRFNQEINIVYVLFDVKMKNSTMFTCHITLQWKMKHISKIWYYKGDRRRLLGVKDLRVHTYGWECFVGLWAKEEKFVAAPSPCVLYVAGSSLQVCGLSHHPAQHAHFPVQIVRHRTVIYE